MKIHMFLKALFLWSVLIGPSCFLFSMEDGAEPRAVGAKAKEPSQIDLELIEAVKNDDIDRASAALSQGANVAASSEGQTLLHLAIQKNNVPLVRLLIQRGAPIDMAESLEVTMHNAAGTGNADLVSLLLNNGADIFAENLFGAVRSAGAHARGNTIIN